MNYTVSINPEFNSTEIFFSGIPSAEIRTALKENKFRWHNVKKCWYGRKSPEEITAVINGFSASSDIAASKPVAAPAVSTVPAAASDDLTGVNIESVLAFINKLDNISKSESGVIEYCLISDDVNRIKSALESAVRTKCNKAKNTPAAVEKAANRIIKSACASGHPVKFSGAAVFESFTGVCDGYRAVRINADSAPILPEAPEAVEASFYEKAFGDIPTVYSAELLLPDIAELKSKIKLDKAAGITDKYHPSVYSFGDELPSVNTQYLIDVIECLPGCRAFIGNKNILLSPIYFKADTGDAILLPVRKSAADKESAAA